MISKIKIGLFVLIAVITHSVQTQPVTEQHELLLQQIKAEEAVAKKNRINGSNKKTIEFNYNNEELVDIINSLAEQKKINLILPSKEADKIKLKLTISLEEKITLDAAWNLLITILDIAGYSLIQEGEWFEIVKNSKDIAREPLPLYIGVSPDKLPDSDLRIRYIYYLSNLKIAPNATTDTNNELNVLLRTLLPEIKDPNYKNFYLDNRTNSIIVADKSNSIKSAMKIIDYLDKIQLQEKLEIIPLRYLSAKVVADLFTRMQEPAEKNRYRLEARIGESSYFSPNVRILPFERGNSLIILGKSQDIQRVRDFIFKYLDVPLESGKSVLHVYQLQYLDAAQFAPVLQNIVKSQTTGPQATGTKTSVEGVERFFDEVIIKADTPTEGLVGGGEATKGLGKYWGGNKLIIAARSEDWIRIKKLIEELDVPQPQVVIEVLIAELTSDQIKQLGSILRNPACFPLPNTVNAQSAQVSSVITAPAQLPLQSGETFFYKNKTLQANLLANPGGVNTSAITPGTSVISFNDKNGSTWALLEVLDFIKEKNIIANPHVIAMNNKETEVNTTEQRLLPDAPVNIGSGSTQINFKWVKAPIKVYVTPRISSANTVNLAINIEIDRFLTEALTNAAAEQARVNRSVTTNANIYSGDILTIGGLTREDTLNSFSQTPILGQIPIIGWLFKNRRKEDQKTNLTVFICPTIIQPRLRAGISEYTTDYVKLSKKFANEGLLFDTLRDPITRWFFRDTEENTLQNIDDFMSQDDLLKKEQYGPTIEVANNQAELTPITATSQLEQMVRENKEEQLATIDTATAINENKVIEKNKELTDKPEFIVQQETNHEPVEKSDFLLAQIKELYKDIQNPAQINNITQEARA